MESKSHILSKPTKRSTRLWAILVLAGSWLLLFSVHGKIMYQPNRHMLANTGEAARVAFVMAGHAQNSTQTFQFEGMNYPYGEHLVYCDAQPLITLSFRMLCKLFSGLENWAVGFQNILTLYSFILAACLYYLLLIRWRVAPWFAALTAMALMLIGPQVLRTPWHTSLAYAWFVPLLLLLFQTRYRNRNWQNVWYIAAYHLGCFLINPYLGTMVAGFFGLFWFFECIAHQKIRAREWGQQFVLIILPGLLYVLFVFLTDGKTDRVSTPLGMAEFASKLQTIFSSSLSPFKSWYVFMGMEPDAWWSSMEGYAYVGFSTNVILFGILIAWVKKGKYWNQLKAFGLSEHGLLMGITCFFGLFALGFPFLTFPSLLELSPALRQLRGVGRYVWIFAIGLNLFAFYQLFKWWSKASRIPSFIRLILAITAISLTGYEGWLAHQEMATHQVEGNPFDRRQLENDPNVSHLAKALQAIHSTDYSAIVPLPFFHIGSELLFVQSHSSYRSVLEAFCFSHHSGIPTTASHLSRNSIEESRKSIQFFAPDLLPKEIEKDINDPKPFLVLFSKTALLPSEEELRFLDLGELVYEDAYTAYYRLPQELVWANTWAHYRSIFEPYRSVYQQYGAFHYFGEGWFKFEAFDDLDTIPDPLSGRALFYQEEPPYVLLDTYSLDTTFSGEMELSFWMKIQGNMPHSILYRTDYLDGVEMEPKALMEARKSFSIYKNWVRWQYRFQVGPGAPFRIALAPPAPGAGFIIDELMIRPIKSSVYTIKGEEWLWNNYPLQ